MIATRPQDPPREVVPWGTETPQWPRPLKFIPVSSLNRAIFWRMVLAEELTRWEQLDDAILGVGQIGDGPLVTVYSKKKALHLLARILEPSERIWISIEDFFNNNIASVNLGPQTPYFIE